MELLEAFLELPRIGQGVFVISMLAAFMIWYSYLHPVPSRPNKTKKYDIEIKSIKAEVSVKDK